MLKIRKAVDGRLLLVRGKEQIAVRVQRCFPWSHPSDFFTLRNHKNEEVGLIRSLSELDEDSQKALSEAVLQSGFIFEVQAIESIDEDFELHIWKVRTKQGARTFQTRQDEWPRKIPGGGYLCRDLAGDLYYFEDPKKLDAKSRKLLWGYVD